MAENEKLKGYEVVVEELRREEGAVHLRARAVELVEVGGEVRRVEVKLGERYRFRWHWSGGRGEPGEPHGETLRFHPEREADGAPHVRAALVTAAGDVLATSPEHQVRRDERGGEGGRERSRPPVAVRLTRAEQDRTRDLILWIAIRYATDSIRFPNYHRFLEFVLCGEDDAVRAGERMDGEDGAGMFHDRPEWRERYAAVREAIDLRPEALRRTPLTGVDAYRALRDATDWFLRIHCGVRPPDRDLDAIEADLAARVGSELVGDPRTVREAWEAYTRRVNGVQTLPYLQIVRDRLADQAVGREHHEALIQCTGLLRTKLQHPCFVELLWSYWQEEGMLVQALNAIANRFQNRARRAGERDPLVNLELDALRPLNNLLWGYVQDELGRLSVVRRAHEYEHAYGLRLEGKAVGDLRPAERRSKFLAAFHTFLLRCVQFYKLDDNTTVIADAFPVLNAIKEVHYLLAQGAHNQFGDLPSTARAEMLVQQWILARPEMREFLGARPAVPYPEPWMDRVDSMKSLQGWTDTSVVHFNDLATFGEQILLGLRYGAWSVVNDPGAAANFVRHWRPEIQGYVHAYLAVTGVDLGAELTSAQAAAQRELPPSVHLLRRLQARRVAR